MTRSLAWMEQAACAGRDPELWYGQDTAAARRVCADCPVRQACLNAAMTTEATLGADRRRRDRFTRHGVWGGLTPDDRSRLAVGKNPRARSPGPARHGTDSGYHRHRRHPNPSDDIGWPREPCEACTLAHRAAERDRGRGAA